MGAKSRRPFRRTRTIPRDAVVRLALSRRGQRLVAETTRDTIDLSGLGTLSERQAARDQLSREMGISAADPADGTDLPKEWEECVTPEGERAVVPNPATRRAQARFATALTAVAATVSAYAARAALEQPRNVALGLIAVTVTAGLGWGTLWLWRGRTEWAIGSGRLTLRRRFGARVRDVFEAERLELSMRTDSDGDEWFTLAAFSGASRRRIASVMHDPLMPRRLGAWLSRAASVRSGQHLPARRRLDRYCLKAST